MSHIKNLSVKDGKAIWSAEAGIFSNAESVHSALVEAKAKTVAFIGTDGQVIHEMAVPGAWPTLGSYATRAGKVLRLGISWEEAAVKRGLKASRPSKAIGLKVEGEKVVVYNDEASVAIDSDLNLTIPATRHNADLIPLIKKAQAFVSNWVLGNDRAWLEANVATIAEAKVGAYSVGISSTATIEQAQLALIPVLMADGADLNLIKQAQIVKTGAEAFVEWAHK